MNNLATCNEYLVIFVNINLSGLFKKTFKRSIRRAAMTISVSYSIETYLRGGLFHPLVFVSFCTVLRHDAFNRVVQLSLCFI